MNLKNRIANLKFKLYRLGVTVNIKKDITRNWFVIEYIYEQGKRKLQIAITPENFDNFLLYKNLEDAYKFFIK